MKWKKFNHSKQTFFIGFEFSALPASSLHLNKLTKEKMSSSKEFLSLIRKEK
jgi:hypothetical protein